MKEFLSQKGVPWTEKYVDEDRGAAIEMIRRSGQRGVPVTVIADEVIVGFDRPRLERAVAALQTRAASQPKRKSLGAKVADAGRHTLPGGMAVEGALVGGVNPGSPAEAAGLRTGDVIVAAGGRPVRSVDDLTGAIAQSDGKPLELSVRRGGNTRDVLVRFE